MNETETATSSIVTSHALRTVTYGSGIVAAAGALVAVASAPVSVAVGITVAGAVAIMSGSMIGLTAELTAWSEFFQGKKDAFKCKEELLEFADKATDAFDYLNYGEKIIAATGGGADSELGAQGVKAAIAIREYRSARREHKAEVVEKAAAAIAEAGKFARMLGERLARQFGVKDGENPGEAKVSDTPKPKNGGPVDRGGRR